LAGLDSSSSEHPAGAARGRKTSSDELPESFFASNVLAVHEDAHPSGRHRAAPAPRPAPAARKVDPARLLESAIEELDAEAASGVRPAALAEDDLQQVESDLSDADELVQTGARDFAKIRGKRSSGERGPQAFSTDEYLRRRARRALVAKLALAGLVVFVLVPFAAGFYFAWGNQRAIGEARAELARGDFDAAGAAAERAGSFWVGEAAVQNLRQEVAFRRALAPVVAAQQKKAFAQALEGLRAVRDEFRGFSAETAALEAEISLAMHLDRAQALEDQGDLAGAVAAYEQARRVAPADGTAEKKVAAIRRALEKEVADAEAQGDLERQIEAYRKLNQVFGGKEREFETRVLKHDLKKFVAGGDESAAAGDFEKALQQYYRASAAAQKLGDARVSAEIEEKTRRARRQSKFQEYFARGEEQAKKGKLDDALQGYRSALNWIEKDDLERAALVQQRVEAVERRKIQDSTDAEAQRLWSEAMAALRKSQTDNAVAALEALRALKPVDEKVKAALEFAHAVTDMVYIPAGECTIGSKPASDVEPAETPERRVSLPAFFIDRYETRNRSYLDFVEKTGAPRPEHWTVDRGERGRGFAPEHADHPVVNVTWFEAQKFAAWAGTRLPGEEEWEKAARGADGRTYPWGEAAEGVKANVGAKVSERVPIMTKPAGTSVGDVSPYGVADMGGNVSEWTASAFKPYPGNDAKGVAWDEEKRVLRGGSWRFGMTYARCAHRDKSKPGERYNETGFRCVKDIPDVLEELR
ncbi:MAG TPA: SUMF1/EgtB/PvdO family nonheme iron enzyme, partial [Planctomycetota bacterium]|nr:SUMF1/EgtB/PvdO family nonheme iron enzyme [Planctomycetota bacterium]